jgi:citronellol/citronellal dehydrogenase
MGELTLRAAAVTSRDVTTLSGKTLFISGASRGIGLAIALRAARDGANIALIAKTAEPHPKLPGTVFTAAKELEEAGGQALPIVGDVRDPDSVEAAVAKTVEQFGGIDICVNNASAINLGSVTEVPMKRFDLMNGIQVRGTYAVSQACIPHLKGRENPHILTLSPPIRLESKWLKPTAYMMAKYGMTLCALGIAEELRDAGIASNTLWPRTMVATAAVQNLLGGDEAMGRARKPEVYSDAAYAILNKPAREYTGNTLLCEDVLLEAGVTDLSVYDCIPGAEPGVDLWVDTPNPPGYTGP